MKAKGTAELPFSQLKDVARQAIITLDLKVKALMSVSKLADAGHITNFIHETKESQFTTMMILNLLSNLCHCSKVPGKLEAYGQSHFDSENRSVQH